ncbi:MAG: DUF3623 family protein, partial [Myxococcota bacterium]
MTTFGPAVLFALFAWWFSTAALLYLDHLPRFTFKRSLAVMSVLAIIAIGGLFYTSRQTSVGSAYLGFICALVMWAWH